MCPSFQVALDIFHSMLLQEYFDLFPKGHLAMMFRLAGNVFLHCWNLGVADRKGELAVGKDADIILFDDDINIAMTIIKGKIVYQRK